MAYALSHRQSRRTLRALHDKYAGERCVIIGNGPSLNETDLQLVRGEFTFGLNRINLAFDRLGFVTSCLVCVNRLVLEQSGAELARIGVPKFFGLAGAHYIPTNVRDVTFLRSTLVPGFSFDPVSRGVWEGATVTFVAMQLAYWFGFRQVVLIGVDHKFSVSGPAHEVVKGEGPDHDHFDPRYFSEGYRWQLPDLATSEVAYAMARKAFETEGREIIDATVGGRLDIFPKAAVEDVLSEPARRSPQIPKLTDWDA